MPNVSDEQFAVGDRFFAYEDGYKRSNLVAVEYEVRYRWSMADTPVQRTKVTIFEVFSRGDEAPLRADLFKFIEAYFYSLYPKGTYRVNAMARDNGEWYYRTVRTETVEHVTYEVA